MNSTETTEQQKPAPIRCTDGLGGVELEDGSIILEDYPTETTRYVLYRHGKTGNLNMLIKQGDNCVSIRTHNMRFLLKELVAKHEPPNDPDQRPGRQPKS